jgi:hypothetical protein
VSHKFITTLVILIGIIALAIALGTQPDSLDPPPPPTVDTTSTPCAIPTVDSGPYLLPTQTPPPVSDTAAWIKFFDPEYHYQDGEYIHTVKLVHAGGFECDEPVVKKRLVWQDTVFNLNAIDPKMSGTMAFDWEPLVNNLNEDGAWDMMGVHSFSMLDASGQMQKFNLREFLKVEAWDFSGTDGVSAKAIFFFDLNFDGYLDMQMKRYSGGRTQWANWLYNPQSHLFELSEDLDAIMYPVYNCQKGLLYTTDGWSGSGMTMSTHQRDIATGEYHRVQTYNYYTHVEYLANDEKYYWKETTWTRFEGDERFLMRRDSVESDW